MCPEGPFLCSTKVTHHAAFLFHILGVRVCVCVRAKALRWAQHKKDMAANILAAIGFQWDGVGFAAWKKIMEGELKTGKLGTLSMDTWETMVKIAV